MSWNEPVFADRAEAGRALARVLVARQLADVVVLALPRGGVPVALPVALALRAPLDLVLVRKIGLPWQPELAMAAVVDGDAPQIVVEPEVLAASGLSMAVVEAAARRELVEIERRRALYLGGRPPLEVAGKTVVLIDDGIATGTTVRAALRALAARRPARVVLAVPVAAPETLARLRDEVDEVICLIEPSRLDGVGAFYRDFHQVGDAEVIADLAAAAA